MMGVQLIMTWLWVCPSCGHENRHRGNKIKGDPFPPDEVPVDEHGNELTVEDFVQLPAEVWCGKCEERHEVTT